MLSIISGRVWNTGRPVLGEVGGVKVIDIYIAASPPVCPQLSTSRRTTACHSRLAKSTLTSISTAQLLFILFLSPMSLSRGLALQQSVLRTPSTRES